MYKWFKDFSASRWRCWLGGRKGIRPVKNWVVECWRGYLSGARRKLAYGPADATATHCLLLSKIQTGFTFLVPADPGSPGQRAISSAILNIFHETEDLPVVFRIVFHIITVHMFSTVIF